jgi:hypothetical protein
LNTQFSRLTAATYARALISDVRQTSPNSSVKYREKDPYGPVAEVRSTRWTSSIWPVVSGSSPTGHTREAQSGPDQRASQTQPYVFGTFVPSHSAYGSLPCTRSASASQTPWPEQPFGQVVRSQPTPS